MARIIFVLIGILATQNVNCAPSDTIDETLESEHDEPTLNDKPHSIFENNENFYSEKSQVQRQKRTFPSIYYLLRLKLQEKLRNKAYLSYPPLQPSLYPALVPDHISQVPVSRKPVTSDETITQAPESTSVNINPRYKNVPTLHDRPPEMEDDRQNWGVVSNNTATDYDDNDNERHIPLIGPSPEPTNVNINPQNETVQTLFDRPPEMEDERQNWGMVINNTSTDYDDNDDDNGRHIPLIGPSPEPTNVNINSQNETKHTLLDRPPKMEDEQQNWGLVINNTATDYDDDNDDNGRHIPLIRPSPEPTNVSINPQIETIPTLDNRPPEMEDERQNWGMLINNTATDYDDDDDDNGRHIPLIGPSPEPTNVSINPQIETIPTLDNRPPEMEDERQNWGMVINNTATDYDNDDDDNGRHIPLIGPSPEPTNFNTNSQNETKHTLLDRPPKMEDEQQNWGLVINNTATDYDDDNDDNGRHIPLIRPSPEPTNVSINPQIETVPTLDNRPPKMEDERQNWGMVINNKTTDYDDDDDDNGRNIPLSGFRSSQADINDTETPPTITL